MCSPSVVATVECFTCIKFKLNMPNNFMTLIHWINSVMGREKKFPSWFVFWYSNLRFPDFLRNSSSFWCIWDYIFFKMDTFLWILKSSRVAVRPSTQKIRLNLVPREKYPSLHKHALFMSSPFGIWEQMFSRMPHTESKITAEICRDRYENALRIISPSVELDTDA